MPTLILNTRGIFACHTTRMGSKTVNIHGFPTTATAPNVKAFLEVHTGEATIFALKFRLPKSITAKSRAYAIVQFITNKYAESIARKRLVWYDGFVLKVRNVERDIVPRPRTSLFVLENTTLHFGSPVSLNKFFVLWSAWDVKVNFGFNLRKIYFFLSWGSHLYKFELAYESIWEIQLHRSSTQYLQFLLIQVCFCNSFLHF